MKLLAPGPASGVPPLDTSRRAAPSPGRELVPVRREIRRDYTTTLAPTTSLPPRGSLVDLLA